MGNSNGPVIDMTPDGRFIEPPKPSLTTILVRLAIFGLILCVGAVLFWTALIVIPLLALLGIAGYFIAQLQLRR